MSVEPLVELPLFDAPLFDVPVAVVPLEVEPELFVPECVLPLRVVPDCVDHVPVSADTFRKRSEPITAEHASTDVQRRKCFIENELESKASLFYQRFFVSQEKKGPFTEKSHTALLEILEKTEYAPSSLQWPAMRIIEICRISLTPCDRISCRT